MTLFSNDFIGQLSYSKLHEILGETTSILSEICAVPISEIKNYGESDFDVQKHEWGDFPVKASWQSPDCRAISLAVYNLAVGCNVSLFSGWEREEFNLKLLRRRHGNRHFGVHIHDKRITGYLTKEAEDELLRQWQFLSDMLPVFPVLNFEERMYLVKEREWYRDEVEDRNQVVGDNPIAGFAEDKGVSIFLAFSSLCLHLAKSETKSPVRNRLLQLALSVLLPIVSMMFDKVCTTILIANLLTRCILAVSILRGRNTLGYRYWRSCCHHGRI